jgi:hypothetical protein
MSSIAALFSPARGGWKALLSMQIGIDNISVS